MKEYKICNIPLNEIHDYLFEILQELDRICRKYNIKYSLEGGTLLGAVKYGDFVPWDDDLDVVMLRTEYERFIMVCKNELSEKFFLQNSDTEKNFPLNYTKLRYRESKYVQKNYEFLDINQGLFLDLYPLDYVDEKRYRLNTHFIGLLNGAKNVKLEVLLSPLHKSHPVSKAKSVAYKLVSRLPLKTLNNALKSMMVSANREKAVLNLCNFTYGDKPINAQRFLEYTELSFRKQKFCVVKEYDAWLKEAFGNYMDIEPDEETRGPSHAIVECELPKGKEKKIGIITFHRADNYGAVLQTYGLSHAIRNIIREHEYDYRCEVIDYVNQAIDNRYHVRTLKEQFEACQEAMLLYGMRQLNPETGTENYETAYKKTGGFLVIELHRMLFPENEKWCIGWNGFFDEIHKQAIERETEGVKINMPQPTDHLFFQFCHARKHLLASGVGIRQICDILLFSEYYEKEIDWEIFWDRIRMTDGILFAEAIFRLGVQYLGFEEKQFYFPEGVHSMKLDTERLMEDILHSGIHGKGTRSRLHSGTLTLHAAEKRGLSGIFPGLFYMVFPPAKNLLWRFPYLKKHPYLLPFAWGQRLCGYLREGPVLGSVKEIVKTGRKRKEILREYGIFGEKRR